MSDEEPLTIYAVRITENAASNISQEKRRLAGIVDDAIVEQWEDGLIATFSALSTMPRRYPVAPEQKYFPGSAPLHALVYRRSSRRNAPAYRIFFTIHEEGDEVPTVRIQHVRHGARAPLGPDEFELES